MNTPSLPELPEAYDRPAIAAFKDWQNKFVNATGFGPTPIDAWLGALSALAADRAATAPDERAAFEAWASDEKLDLNRNRHSYMSVSTAWCWDAWQARAALTARGRRDE